MNATRPYWCCLMAPSHYMSQCWPRPMSPYGVIRPRWVLISWSTYKWHPKTMTYLKSPFHTPQLELWHPLYYPQQCSLHYLRLRYTVFCESVNQPSLIQIMDCRLDGPKPLSQPMLEYCVNRPLERNFSEVLSKIYTFSFKKIKKLSAAWRPFCLSLNVLITSACPLSSLGMWHCISYCYVPVC